MNNAAPGTRRTGPRLLQGRTLVPLLAIAIAGAGLIGGPAQAQGTAGAIPTGALPTYGDLLATSSTSSTDAWAVGWSYDVSTQEQGTLVEHFNGHKWKRMRTPNIKGNIYCELTGVSAISATDVWASGYCDMDAAGDSAVLFEHYNGNKWKLFRGPAGDGGELPRAISGDSADDVWATGYDFLSGGGLVYHWDGTSWSEVESGAPGNFYAVAVSPTDVWAAGFAGSGGQFTTFVEHWDGTSWTVVSSPNPKGSSDTELQGLSAVSASDVWASGYSQVGGDVKTLIEHWDGTTWTIVRSPNVKGAWYSELAGVSADSATGAWAVGFSITGSEGPYETLVEHWNGHKWKIVVSPNPDGSNQNTLAGVTAISSKTAVAVGAAATASGGAIPLVEQGTTHAWKIKQPK